MTLVIACKSRDGIIVAADSKASYDYDGEIESRLAIEDTQKIIELGNCCVALVYGDGTDDYDAFFNLFKEESVVYAGYKGMIDYDFCITSLPSFLSEQYGPRLKNLNKVVGVMVVGVANDNEYKICDMLSAMRQGREPFYPFETTTYHYGGMTQYAKEYFVKNKHIIAMGKNDVAARLKSVIKSTADMFPDKVNKNIVIKHIDVSGITTIR
jgi:hypothetical protein